MEKRWIIAIVIVAIVFVAFIVLKIAGRGNSVWSPAERKRSKDYKKRIIIIISIVLALAICFVTWWIMPKSLCKTDVEKVEKITIFSGHVGKEIQITDEEEITELMEKFSSVKMKVKKISGISMGYMYNVTIETNYGKKEFTVNSKYDIDGKVWLYKVIDGDNGYDYIDNMFQKFYD